MNTFILTENLLAFGFQVKNFPEGIDDAFKSLIKKVDGGFTRSFYGISSITQTGEIVYLAAAQELRTGEAEELDCEKIAIAAGSYSYEVVKIGEAGLMKLKRF
ncbi:hypothetical protein GS399_08085 [Pedobacter sp. HMF7647]|uniref:Uncharacterized protein n=1 Tax=Hufsiella arboris TaxID=2695275 RepID=A0A7K1Y988_9SPHI|nr:hypothetical protein [Hufsiella arboris]MXV50931.1 hypothetical protein [Hufsiella arboris]